MYISKTIDEIQVGDTAEICHIFSKQDVDYFASVTLDFNPIHIDDDYAASSYFGKKIVHGMLVGSLISSVIGTKLPGAGTLYISQNMKYLAPVYLDDVITARVTVEDVIPNRNRVICKTECFSPEGILVVEGQAVVSPVTKKYKQLPVKG